MKLFNMNMPEGIKQHECEKNSNTNSYSSSYCCWRVAVHCTTASVSTIIRQQLLPIVI